jgi:ABC-2 type transport system permease protein
MPLVLAIFLPVLTMRLLADEFRSGTIETLMTAPVNESDVVLGKFLGAFLFYAVMLLGVLVFAFVVAAFGNLDGGVLAGDVSGFAPAGRTVHRGGGFLQHVHQQPDHRRSAAPSYR